MQRAFSLIEIVLVVVIVGIVAAVAIPRIGSAQAGTRIESADKRMRSEFVAVGELARANGRSHTVQISLPDSQIRVYEGTPPSLGPQVRTVSMAEQPYAVRFVSTTISDPNGYITVDGYGMYSANARVRIETSGIDRVVDLKAPVRTTLEEGVEATGGTGGGLLGGIVNGLLGL